MFNNIFDELKVVKYLPRNNRFQDSFNVKCFKEIKPSSKSSAIFRTQANIYDGAFCEYT